MFKGINYWTSYLINIINSYQCYEDTEGSVFHDRLEAARGLFGFWYHPHDDDD